MHICAAKMSQRCRGDFAKRSQRGYGPAVKMTVTTIHTIAMKRVCGDFSTIDGTALKTTTDDGDEGAMTTTA